MSECCLDDHENVVQNNVFQTGNNAEVVHSMFLKGSGVSERAELSLAAAGEAVGDENMVRTRETVSLDGCVRGIYQHCFQVSASDVHLMLPVVHAPHNGLDLQACDQNLTIYIQKRTFELD